MEANMKTYDIKYSCGCIHEIEDKKLEAHKPTGNNKDCKQHKKLPLQIIQT